MLHVTRASLNRGAPGVLGGGYDLPGLNFSGSLQDMWSLPLQPVVATKMPKFEMKQSSMNRCDNIASAHDKILCPHD